MKARKTFAMAVTTALVLTNSITADATSLRVVGGTCAIQLDNELQADVATYLTSVGPISQSRGSEKSTQFIAALEAEHILNFLRDSNFDYEQRARELEERERQDFERSKQQENDPNRFTAHSNKVPTPASERIEAYKQYLPLLQQCAEEVKREAPQSVETTKVISQTIVQPVTTVVIATTVEQPAPSTPSQTPAPEEPQRATEPTESGDGKAGDKVQALTIASIVLSAIAVILSLVGLAAPSIGLLR